MTKADGVAVLRERQPRDMQPSEAIELLRGFRVFLTSREKAKDPEGPALFDEALRVLAAALSAQPIGYMDPAAEFLLPKPDGCVLSSHIDLLLVRDPYGRFTQPLYLHPAPPGSDAVTEEMAERIAELVAAEMPSADLILRCVEVAAKEALASRTGKGEA